MNSQNQEKKTKKINISLNVLKCITIFAVMCGHSRLFLLGHKGLVIDGIIRFSCPVFFMISGYFSYITDNEIAMKKYKKRLIKLIQLLIVANIIYFLSFVIQHPSLIKEYVFIICDINNIFSYILLNVSPTSLHLWFLESLIYCYIIYYILCRFKINPNVLYKYIPLLLIGCILLGELFIKAGIKLPIEYYRNFIFMGIPFFAIGYLIHEKEKLVLDNFSNRLLIGLIVLGCALSALEVLVIDVADLFVGSIILSTCMFIWCIKNPTRLKNFKITSFIGQHLYASMYILHLVVADVVLMYLPLSYAFPIVLFICTTLLSGTLYLIFKYIKRINIFNKKGIKH